MGVQEQPGARSLGERAVREDVRQRPQETPDEAPRRRGRGQSLAVAFGLPGIIFVGLILLLPIVALVWRTAESGVFLESVRKPIVVQALKLTGGTSLITLLPSGAFRAPLAYGLARARFPGKRAVDTLVDLPIVLPPVVAGVG